MPLKLVPFEDDLLNDAAELLAARHRRDRLVLHELPARFENANVAQTALEAAWRRPGASGAAVLEGGRLIGYLIGDLVSDPFRGRSAWVRLAGHALDEAASADLYCDLYAAAAQAWVARGYFIHYVLIPMDDLALLSAWAALAFAPDQVYALRSITEADADPGFPPDSVTIRRATPGDWAALADLAPLIGRHQAGPPSWSPIPPEDIAELRRGYAELVDDPDWTVWLALHEGQVLGFQAYHRVEASDEHLLTPAGCIELKVAGIGEKARGRGIGSALTRYGLADAWANDYVVCAADWHVPNLLASRFWPRRGFVPMVYRMIRRIDPRIAWADGRT